MQPKGDVQNAHESRVFQIEVLQPRRAGASCSPTVQERLSLAANDAKQVALCKREQLEDVAKCCKSKVLDAL
jgi:hypothetical protein